MLWAGKNSPQHPAGAGSEGPSSPSRRCSTAANRAPGEARAARLGSTAKSVRHSAVRAARFRHQRHAAKLLGGKARVGLCRWSVISKAGGVDLVASSYVGGQQRTHFEGVQTCGSVWVCPCCSARISETRRGEMNSLLSWARSQGYTLKMITLTARHGHDDDLAELLDRMKDAKRRWARHRAYGRIKTHMIGSVTATEVTGGGVNGWHPHFHVILVLDGTTDLAKLEDAWLASLKGAGLEGAGAAFQIQDAEAAGEYIAKWGAAEEVALSGRKNGRVGRTPGQLLAASSDDDDAEAGALWAEYARVFHGKRQLVWSRGLKDLAGIGEVTDNEAAQDERQDGQIELGRSNIPHETWRSQVAARTEDRRSDLLNRADEVGPDQAVQELQKVPSDNGVVDDDPFIPPPDIERGGLRHVLEQQMKEVRRWRQT